MTEILGDKKIEIADYDGDRPICTFYMPKKRRQCRMTRKASERLCSEHILVLKDEVQGRKRIVCPIDSTHTVWEDQVKKHMKKCADRRKDPVEDWFQKNYNWHSTETKAGGGQAGSIVVSDKYDKYESEGRIEDGNDRKKLKLNEHEHDHQEEERRATSDENGKKILPANDEMNSDIQDTCRLIEKLFECIAETVSFEVLSSHGLDERLLQVENPKHALQQSSLIGHMEELKCFDQDHCIVEFGCGRAELSRYTAKARLLQSKSRDPQKFYLIDRQSPRGKFDSKMEIEDDATVRRLKVDIKDLVLSKLVGTDANVMAISKHLCGVATDLSLECLRRSEQDTGRKSTTTIVFALCCRQICDYHQYFGREWLKAQNITESEFDSIKRLTSWCICGPRTTPYQMSIGQKARMIIDYGRLLEVRTKMGMKAKLVHYVDPSTSKENVALVAWR